MMVRAEQDRVIVEGEEMTKGLATQLAQWFHRPKLLWVQGGVSFQSASPRLAQFKVDVLRRDLHYRGLLRADEVFENKVAADKLYGCRP